MKSSSTHTKAITENEAGDIFSEENKYWNSFQNMLLQAPVGIAIFRGSTYKVELANDMALAIINKDRSFIGKPLFEVMPELVHPIKDIFDHIMQTGIPFTANEMELTVFRNGKNETGWLNVNYQPIRDDDKTISGIFASANEVTEQVLARKRIEDSEKRYNMMLMKSPFGFAVLKAENLVITLANDTLKEIWGKGKDVEGKPLFDLLPELKDSEFPSLLDAVYTTGVPFQGNDLLAPLLRNGKLEDAYFNLVYQPYLEADETISGVTVIAYEVTSQVMVKKALEAQRAAEQKASKLVEETNKHYYSMLMDSPFAFCVMKGKNMTVILANDLIKEFWGKGNMVEGKTILQVLPELNDQPIPAMLDNVFTTGIPLYANEILVKLLHQDTMKERYFNIVYQPDHDTDGTISGVITIAYDVTEMVLSRKKAEESDKRYNMMLMHSTFTFAVLKGKELLIDLANDQIKEVWGLGNDIEGKSLLEIMPELKDSGFPDLLEKVRVTGIPFHGVEVQSPKSMHGQIKEAYFFNFVFQPYLEADQTISGITIIGNDVTEQVLAKKKIEESEQRFRALADNVPMHIFIIEPNAEASISYFNKYWLDYTGQTLEEALGRTWTGIIHPDDVQNVMDAYLPAYQKQQAYNLPAVRVRRYDGVYRWFQVYANPRYLPNGEFMGFIGAGFDIHESKLAVNALKESEEHFRQLAELMPAKISNADAAGNVSYFNKHWLTFSGYTFEELRDFGYHQIIHPDEFEAFQQSLHNAAETGTDSVMEMRFKNKEGVYIWHLNIASPVIDKNGKHTMWVGVTTEMQHQKEQREELEHAVLERTVALSVANEELKKMNKELEAFAYVSSHDLQEPLRKIRTMAGRIMEKENENLSDSGKYYFHLIQNAAERMQTLIKDLLAFSRLSMADRKYENTHLNSIIEDVKNEFKETITEKNAIIEIQEICSVKIIPFQFRQLMHNLIGNALKFSNPTIPPHIKISSVIINSSNINVANLAANKPYCHICIADNGIGFKKEFTEKIFEVFQKLHAKDEYAGTGIGLAIVKKIVENHNGIITVTSELDKGTAFNIYIPA